MIIVLNGLSHNQSLLQEDCQQSGRHNLPVIEPIQTIKEVLLKKPNKDLPSAEDLDFKVWLDTSITEELKIEATARELVRTIQSLRKDSKLHVEDIVKVIYKNEGLNKRACEIYGEQIKNKGSAISLEPGEEFSVQKV